MTIQSVRAGRSEIDSNGPTFCSGGNAARRNWLFSRLSTQQLNRFSVYPPEKLLGKLLGGVPFTVLVREQRLEAWMIGERGYIAALSNAFDNPSRRAWRKRTPGKHSRNFLRPRECGSECGAFCAPIFRAQGKQHSGIDRRVFGFSPGILTRSREVNNLGNSPISE